ncbi:MAG: tRNA preQ1(34) S-adenosylmethionine ribosyltransferase-isomerase QueA [Aphanocapsa sp. GSE-SYN-MK-11-07L]|nr:tRNA preQ1(34) S-adenosylmethionine ribosyltransferase-isomerase QueA [Aphanocapsa sp. GSE-SYN-MK-11-07L]
MSGNDPSLDPEQRLSSYDYDLPASQIAQSPAVPRDSSRLLVVEADSHRHQIFRELPELLRPGDLLVMNNTRVIPARLLGRKVSQQGSLPVEVLLLEEQADHRWLALVKPGRRLKPGSQIEFGQVESVQIKATVLETDLATRGRILVFDLPVGDRLLNYLDQIGQLPLPPYITGASSQPEQYQTIYGDRPGAVAAPTAGLHFTPELLTRLTQQGIQHCFSTLHVGVGTFRPVEAENIQDHIMHQEWLEVSPGTVAQIQQTQAQGGRIIAVGTTVVRALETAAQSGKLQPFRGKTNLFIFPGYRWQVVEGMITNFHLPRSSLLMLVSALIGRERLLNLYQTAIAAQYRFYSFGDAMLILPVAKSSAVDC